MEHEKDIIDTVDYSEVYAADVSNVKAAIKMVNNLQQPKPKLSFTIVPFDNHYTVTTGDFRRELDIASTARKLLPKKGRVIISSARINPYSRQLVVTVPMADRDAGDPDGYSWRQGSAAKASGSEKHRVLREEPAKDEAILNDVVAEDLPAIKHAINRIKTLQVSMPVMVFKLVDKKAYYNILIKAVNEFLDVGRMEEHWLHSHSSREVNYISNATWNPRSQNIIVSVSKTQRKEKRINPGRRARRRKVTANPY